MSDRNSARPQVPGHRVDSVIGRGASSTVWQGRDAMGRPVAIKVPHETGWLADEGATRTEAHVLMAVRHEHLVTLRDVVELADGRVALVFDLVTGASLSSTVAARGRLRPGETVTVLTPMCEALEALHGAGGLHGDVSPSNVMLTAAGKPLLLDLGAARLAGLPLDAPVYGTPGFVAPEVRQGLAPTEASDVFSLGALAWFCLTGNGAPDTMLRLDPEVIHSHVGGELAEVIGACIDPDPARRPSSPEVARLFYETVPAEAVEVVVGADEASALTHRMRAEARGDVPEVSTGARPDGWSRWLPGRGLRGRGLRGRRLPGRAWSREEGGTGSATAALGRRDPAGGRGGGGAQPTGGRPRRTVLLLVALAVLVVVLLGVGVLSARSPASATEPLAAASTEHTGRTSTEHTGRTSTESAAARGTATTPAPPRSSSAVTPDAPAASSTPTPTPSGSPQRAATPSGPATGADSARGGGGEALLRRADAPRATPHELLQALSDRRAEALVARDPARLAGVDQSASPAHAADAATISRLRADGARWEGLSLEVAEATFLSARGTAASGRPEAVVRARVDWTAYTVVSGDGRFGQPPETGDVLDFALVLGPDGWRLTAVSAPAT